MGIQHDAGELLALIYQNKVSGKGNINTNQIEKETNWVGGKMTFALEYLIGKGLIDGEMIKGMGSGKTQFIHIKGITCHGIDVIENEEKFKGNFGFGINLGLVNFSWSKK